VLSTPTTDSEDGNSDEGTPNAGQIHELHQRHQRAGRCLAVRRPYRLVARARSLPGPGMASLVTRSRPPGVKLAYGPLMTTYAAEMTSQQRNPRHLTDEDRMAAAIAMVGAIRQRHATGVDAIEAAMLVEEIERHAGQLRSAGEDRALAIMAYLIHDIVHTASVRTGTSWEDAWEAAARQARVSMARIVRERGEYDEKRPGDRF
jgi:hypothetical protein